MERRGIGSSGMVVGCIGLGGMPLSIQGRPPEEQGLNVIHAALDAGMDFVDTADVYCLDHRDIGHNERLVARALRERKDRDRIVVATKGGLERPDGAWTVNGRPDHLRRACDASLRALGVDRIALYQLHAPDDDVPFAESVGALADLRREGKIAHVGLSNVSVDEIVLAQSLVPIVSVQNRCNPYDRSAWADGVVQLCEAQGIAFLPYSPVGGSRGKTKLGEDPVLARVGRRHGATAYQVALAWLLAKCPVAIPIPGASRVRSAMDSAAAANIRLGAEDLAELDAAFPTT